MITKPEVLETITETLKAECQAFDVDPKEVLRNMVSTMAAMQAEAEKEVSEELQ